MADLDIQLRNLADHRAAQVPERPVEADEGEVAEPEPEPRGRSRGLLAVAAIVLVAIGTAAFLASRSSSDEVVMIDTSVDLDAPLPMTERGIVERDDWTAPLDGLRTPSTFLVASVDTVDDIQAANAGRADDRFRPASTFKLLNALLFLETGVVADLNEEVAWDGVDRGMESWNRTHSVASALEVSAVWVFEELAGRIDAETTAELVASARYGNADVGDATGAYWLDGELRISAVEQLAFLEDLYLRRLPLDLRNQADLFHAMSTTPAGRATIHYKTGTALAGPNPVAWLVGIVDSPGGAHVFAFNTDIATVDGELVPMPTAERLALVSELLVAAGIAG